MTRTLLTGKERLRYIASLLIMLFAYATGHALTSDEINEAIVTSSSVPLTWTDDASDPWRIVTNSDETYLSTPAITSGTKTSSIKFEYKSDYPTGISFQWKVSGATPRNFDFLIDGVSIKTDGSGYWGTIDNHKVPAGSHVVEFKCTYTYNSSSEGSIKNLSLVEYKPLEDSCVMEGSLPLTFENDPNNPWLTEDGYIKSMDTSKSSEISTTFTIDKPSLFSYNYRNLRDYSYYCTAAVYIDDVLYRESTSPNWVTNNIVLYPGTHTIAFKNLVRNNSSNNETQVRNVCLSQTWDEVTVANPGEFIATLASVIGTRNLSDVRMVKVKGSLNDSDWSGFKQLTGIVGIDLTETDITSIPSSAFSKLSSLSTVMMPETVVTIGGSAFQSTNCYQINVPASVESIGNFAWDSSYLTYINFPEDSRLKSIGYAAFADSDIREFIMPNAVESLGSSNNSSNYGIFANCSKLSSLHLSSSLKSLPYYMLYRTTNLKEVQIPESVTSIGEGAFYDSGIQSVVIPKNVNTLGNYAFSGCDSLKNVTLNSRVTTLNTYTFRDCPEINTITITAATPPAVAASSDPFNATPWSAKVIVPDFAYTAFKADAYWCKFTNIEASEELSKGDYWSIHGPLTLNGDNKMTGAPSITIENGGSLTVGAGSKQDFNEITYSNVNRSECFLNRGATVTAKKVTPRYYLPKGNTWYFFSPVTDVKMSDVSFTEGAAWVIRSYDGARRASENSNKGNWIDMTADGILKRGQGYIVQSDGAGWLELPAAESEYSKFLGSEEATLTLADNACENAENAGWNFIGNPYAAYYDIAKMDLQAPITVWNGSTYTAYSLTDDEYALNPQTPFFVQKYNTALTLSMPKAGCQTTSTVTPRANAPRKDAAESARHLLNLRLNSGDSDDESDRTRIVINEEAAMAYEPARDASKFMSMDATVAQIYSIGEGRTRMAINERPYADGNVALGVYFPESGKDYRISASRIDRKAWIYDAATGIEQDLTEGDYIFTSLKAGADDSRFSIRFAPAAGTAAEAVEADAVKVAGGKGVISIAAPRGAEVAVFAADGSVAASVKGEGSAMEIPAAAGVYVVNVNGQSFKTIVK